jgi:hypothetical protein
MKHILFSALIGFAFCAWAQAPKEPAKTAPQAKEAAKPAPAKQAAKSGTESTKQAAVTKKPRRWNEDARHCLERGSTTEIIKCAEEYL